MKDVKGTKMTEKEFSKIKKLTDIGVPTHMVSEITGRSKNVAFLVGKMSNWSDYLKYKAARNGAPKKYHKPETVLKSKDFVNGDAELLTKIYTKLEMIDRKLDKVF